MSNTAYCRGCGKEIHSDVFACPHCGTPQLARVSKAWTPRANRSLAVASCALGLFTLFIIVFDESTWMRDEVIGGILFALAGVVCGALSIYHQKPGSSTAVVGLVTAGTSLLFFLTNL